MGVKLDGKYKGYDYMINTDGLSALIFTGKGILRKDYPDLQKYNLKERIIKIKSRIYNEVNKNINKK